MSDRQKKDPVLVEQSQDLNKDVSKRLREKYVSWKKGKPQSETKYAAIVTAIYQELNINVSYNTVKTHLGGDNASAVPLPLLCWYAKKFGTSVNYLLTNTDDAPKNKVDANNATVSDVLEALQLILEVFEPSISLEKTTERQYGIVHDGSFQQLMNQEIRAIAIEDSNVQTVLHWWDLYQKTANNAEVDREELKSLLFTKHLEELSEEPRKLLNGKILKQSETYAFLQKENPDFSNGDDSTDRRRKLLVPIESGYQYYFTYTAVREGKGEVRWLYSFAKGSEWTRDDVDKNEEKIVEKWKNLNELPF